MSALPPKADIRSAQGEGERDAPGLAPNLGYER